jgi:Protein of unknown function (DUF1580)
VAIDPFAEEILSFAAAARRLPKTRADKPVSPTTIWRWAAHGLRGVKLESVRLGGTTCTSVEALRRFFQALDAKARGEAVSVAGPGTSEYQSSRQTAELDRVDAELAKVGI